MTSGACQRGLFAVTDEATDAISDNRLRPKSVTLACQSRSTSKLGDFKSLCMMDGLCECKYSIPCAASIAIDTRRCHDSADARAGSSFAFCNKSESDPCSQYSVTTHGGLVHTPRNRITFGCLIAVKSCSSLCSVFNASEAADERAEVSPSSSAISEPERPRASKEENTLMATSV